MRTASTIKFEDTLQVNSEQDALKELEKVVIFHGHADDYSISNYSSITAPITTSMPGDWSPVELGTLV